MNVSNLGIFLEFDQEIVALKVKVHIQLKMQQNKALQTEDADILKQFGGFGVCSLEVETGLEKKKPFCCCRTSQSSQNQLMSLQREV
ncbi:MAG: hypothetical protein EZS28_055308, partial [Streblomastix strix]